MSLDAYLAPHRAGLEARAENLVDFPQKFVAADDAQPIGQAQLLQMVREQLHTGGKRLRALLTPAMVAAAGGPIEAARDFGACVELVHNGTLVHDDIQDNDRLRRGQPTLWTTHGMPQAINAGDAMLVGPLAALLIAPQIELRHRLELANVLAHALMETVRGQVADVALHGTQRPTRQQIEAVHLGKTGPLFGACFVGAAILLDLPESTLVSAQALGRQVGLAFQIRDDILDLLGTKGRGDAGADVREGKLTWPMLLALEQGPREEGEELRSLLQRAAVGLEPDDVEVARWVQWAHQHQGVEMAQLHLQQTLDAAAESAAVFPPAAADVVLALCDRLRALDS